MPALNFSTNPHRVNHGTAHPSLDTQTWVFWYRPNQINESNRRLVYQGDNAGNNLDIAVGRTGGQNGTFAYIRDRATTATTVRSTVNTFASGNWYFVAVTDQAGVAPTIYSGTPTTVPAALGSYHARTTGVGAANSNAGQALIVGGTLISDFHFANSRIAYVAGYDRILTLGEITLLWAQPHLRLSGCTFMSMPGMHGGSGVQQPDMSGNGHNGAVSGAPGLVDTVPGLAYPVPLQTVIWIPPAVGGPVNVLAAAGAIPLVGQASTISRGANAPAVQGSLGLVGQDAHFHLGRNIDASQAAIPLAGQAATISRGADAPAVQGSLALLGQTATITTGGEVVAAQGTFNLAGQTATVAVGVDLAAQDGTLALVGGIAAIVTGFNLDAQQGTIPLTGQTATPATGANAVGAQGSLALVGQGAIITGSAGAIAAQGQIALLGQTATITDGAGQIVAAPGTIPLVGGDALAFNVGGSKTPIAREGTLFTLTRERAGTTLIREG